MGNLARDLTIGVIGSIIGALIVFLASYGFRFTKKRRDALKKEFENEQRLYDEDFPGARQKIMIEYLFSILKYLLLGNVAWTMPSIMMLFPYTFESIFNFQWSQGIGGTLGLIFFYFGLGKTIRFMKISKGVW